MAKIPGVQSVDLGTHEPTPIVHLRLAPGARAVADIDEVCASLDVTVLSSSRSAPRATRVDGEPMPQAEFAGVASATRLAPSEAMPELLAGALCLSGRRFLQGTSQTDVLKSVAVLHAAISAGNTPFYSLPSCELGERADVVEHVAETLGAA